MPGFPEEPELAPEDQETLVESTSAMSPAPDSSVSSEFELDFDTGAPSTRSSIGIESTEKPDVIETTAAKASNGSIEEINVDMESTTVEASLENTERPELLQKANPDPASGEDLRADEESEIDQIIKVDVGPSKGAFNESGLDLANGNFTGDKGSGFPDNSFVLKVCF